MKQVLLLNASHEVLRPVGLRRAVVLVLQDKAEVVEAGEEYVRSASFQMLEPRVIRLKYYVTIPWSAKVALNRKNLIARDRGECQRVGCTRKGTTIDHIVPRSRGGRHEWTNVTLMCAADNSRKSDKLLSELGWELKHEPSVPRANRLLIGIAEMDPVWEPHIVFAS